MTDVFFCQQRQLRSRFNNPNPRFSLSSPYTGTNFTQRDLDMRRKAEILQYKKNNSQSNSQLTKKELYAKAVKTTRRLVDPSCKAKTSSSAAGVPGPIIDLYLDDSIPLYNFKSHLTRTYDEITEEPINLIPPVLTLNGPSIINLTIGTEWNDPNAYSFNGELIQITGDLVDPETPGTYTIEYTATDLGGNSSSIFRTVIVNYS